MNAVSSLQALTKETEEISSKEYSMIFDSGKKLKKRSFDEDNEEIAGKSEKRKILHELVLRSEYVLDSVKCSCMYDTEGFIDEVRTWNTINYVTFFRSILSFQRLRCFLSFAPGL